MTNEEKQTAIKVLEEITKVADEIDVRFAKHILSEALYIVKDWRTIEHD